MKIKSRKEKISEYNRIYEDRILDPEERVRSYFEAHGLNLEKACKKAAKKLKDIQDSREYSTVHITLYEYPMKTDRPRTFRGHTYSPNAAENKRYFERALQQVVKQFKLINTPAEIVIDAYLEMPAKVPPDEVILFEAKVLNVVDKPDYDNVGKCYTDMLTDVLIVDDDIFYRGTITKYYSLLPRVDITITYITKHESDYLYKKIKSRKGVKAAMKRDMCVVERLSGKP